MENEESKKSTYNAQNQKVYRKKVKQYNVKYSLSEDDVKLTNTIDQAISDSNLTANKWIQKAIIDKLVKDGYLPDQQ